MKLWTGSYIFTTGRQPSVHAAAVVIESVLLKFLLGSSCLFKSLALLILLTWLVHLVKSLPLHTLEPRKRYPFRAEPPHIGHYRKYPPPPPPRIEFIYFYKRCRWWNSSMRTMMLARVYLNELQQIHELLPRTDLNTIHYRECQRWAAMFTGIEIRTGGLCATLLKWKFKDTTCGNIKRHHTGDRTPRVMKNFLEVIGSTFTVW